MTNYGIRANLSAFMTCFSLVFLVAAFILVREFFPVIALGLLIGNGLAIAAHRLLFPGRWTTN